MVSSPFCDLFFCTRICLDLHFCKIKPTLRVFSAQTVGSSILILPVVNSTSVSRIIELTITSFPGKVKGMKEEFFLSILLTDFFITLYNDVARVKRSESRSCLHDKAFELGTRPAKHEKAAIYVVNQRISNVCSNAGNFFPQAFIQEGEI